MVPKERIKEWCNEHSHVDENLFIRRLRSFLTDEQIIKVLDAMNVCHGCWNREGICYCERDD
jgi:hypothetical protein